MEIIAGLLVLGVVALIHNALKKKQKNLENRWKDYHKQVSELLSWYVYILIMIKTHQP